MVSSRTLNPVQNEARDARRAATYALAVLTFINLFNYLDRWVVAAVVESIKRDLGLADTQLGFIGAGFIIIYTVSSPWFGRVGDRSARPPLIAVGVFLWSLATGLAGFARGFFSLLVARSAVGVGEAAYGTIAPALLADHFPLEKRGRVMSMFFAAIPIGSAAGYILGGLVDAQLGWRAAFWIAGAPGILLAVLVWKVRDAPRGQYDVKGAGGVARAPTLLAAYTHLLKNRTYVLAVLGYGAYTFALGGLAFWMPAFLERVRGLTRSEATVTFGVVALVTGFVGTFSGGFIGDLLLKKTRNAYLWVAGIATLAAAPLTYLALAVPERAVWLPAIVVAEILIFMSTGPVNSAIVNVVSPAERATAVGLSVFAMHFFGDIPSPPLIGMLSDASSLSQAFLIVPIAIVVSGALWTYAAWRGE